MTVPFTGSRWNTASIGTPGGIVTWTASSMASRLNTFDRMIVQSELLNAVRLAFDTWEKVANINFDEVVGTAQSDIKLGWDTIDGLNGTLAEATWTFSGGVTNYAEIVFDTAERWQPGSTGSGNNFFAVALHEIGHAIGLDHADEPGSIMYPYLSWQTGLSASDLTAIRNLYGLAPTTGDSPGMELTGTTGNDTLTGTAWADFLDGQGGNDILLGALGNDKLYGGTGDDLLGGGGGNDFLSGGDGSDSLDAGLGDDEVQGGAGKDRLIGDSGDDNMEGGADDDVVLGGDGADILRGNDGDDLIGGGSRSDRLEGNGGNDSLDGGAGNDALYGGSGNDTLVGDGGSDLLFGGSGSDVFRFAGDGGTDTVVDFQVGVDRLHIESSMSIAQIVANAVQTSGDSTILVLENNTFVILDGVQGLTSDWFV